MKREMIKYRQWNQDFNCWNYWGFLENDSFTNPRSLRETNYRYTGYQDRNGNDIYEGDIDDRHDVIHFSRGCWWVGGFMLHRFEFNDVVLIGNIEENPELLEE